MHRLGIAKVGVAGCLASAGLLLVACQSTQAPRDGQPQALSGVADESDLDGTKHSAAPRYEAHGKGNQWGRIVHER